MFNMLHATTLFTTWSNDHNPFEGITYNLWSELIYYSALFFPALAIVFLSEPRDLFAELNSYPEQGHRVSVTQYERVNYNRFRTMDEILASREFL